MIRIKSPSIAALIVGLVAGMMSAVVGTAAADTIALRNAVRLPADAQVVTLADIAEIEGEMAERFADLFILELPESGVAVEINVRDVRQRLHEAGAHWGRINLSGRKVIVRPGRGSEIAPPLANAPVSLAEPKREASAKKREPSRVEVRAVDVINQPTLRGMIANLIVNNLNAQAHDVALFFENDDAELLDRALEGARFELQPLGSFVSERIELAVRIWSDGRVTETHRISVLPKLRVQATVLRHDIGRNHVLSDADLETVQQWLSPPLAAMTVHRVAAVGRVAVRSMKAGEVLREKHIHRETLVKRGDLVIVRCLVGGVAISLQAEARSDGGEGDVIEFRKQGERETFLATVVSRGEAVLDLAKR